MIPPNHQGILCTWTLITFMGFAMSQCLLTGGFKWFSQKKIEKINLATCAADGKKDMITGGLFGISELLAQAA